MGVNRKGAHFNQLQRQLESLPTYSLASSALPYDQIKRAAVTSGDSWDSLTLLGRAEEQRDRERDLHVAAGRSSSTLKHSGAVRRNEPVTSEEHTRVLRALDSDASDNEPERKGEGRQRWSHRLLDRMGAIVTGSSGHKQSREGDHAIVVGVPVRSGKSSSHRKRGGSKKSSSSNANANANASELDMVLPTKPVVVFSVSYDGVEVPVSWPTGKNPGEVFRISVENLFDPARLARVDAQLSGQSGGLLEASEQPIETNY